MNNRPTVRSEILRRYYEATYGGRPVTKEAIADATFDEYLAIRRMLGPRLSAWTVARDAPRDDFRALAATLPPDPPYQPALPVTAHLERRPAIDLREAPINPEASRVIVDRIKLVSGWEGLRRAAKLDDLDVVFCACERDETIDPPLSLRKLSIRECTDACLRLLLGGAQARDLEIFQTASPIVRLGPVAEQRRLASLSVSAPLVRGVASLAGLPLATLRLGRVEPDDALRSALAALAGTLADLSLTGTRPFGPEALPPLPHLARLRVPGDPEHRQAWIDFAVAHPEIGFSFPTPTPPDARAPALSVEEIHRGVDILRAVKGSKVGFEIAADLAGMIPGFEGDNGDLEDQLRDAARAAKQKIAWGSEADTLVARAASVEPLRWVIEAALALPAGRPQSTPAPKKTAAKKTAPKKTAVKRKR